MSVKMLPIAVHTRNFFFRWTTTLEHDAIYALLATSGSGGKLLLTIYSYVNWIETLIKEEIADIPVLFVLHDRVRRQLNRLSADTAAMGGGA